MVVLNIKGCALKRLWSRK